MVEITRYEVRHFDGVVAIWEEAFPDDPPWNRAENAVPAKVAFQPDLFFVAVEGDEVIGTAMAGQHFDVPSIENTPLLHYLILHTAMAGRRSVV